MTALLPCTAWQLECAPSCAMRSSGLSGVPGEDRRSTKRYPLNLDLRWELIRRGRVLEAGIGQTMDVSSGGILFHAGKRLPQDCRVRLRVTWPVRTRGLAPMHLAILGHIRRSQGPLVAVQTCRCEFRIGKVNRPGLSISVSPVPNQSTRKQRPKT